MTKKYQRRKRNYLINKNLQGKLGLQYLLLTLIGVVLLGFLFFASSSDYLTISYDTTAIEVGSTPQVLLGEILRSSGIFLLFGCLLIVLITIVLTHKIAGPLYRFEQTFKAMCQGKLDEKIYLRKGDEGQALGKLINEFNLSLAEDIRKIQRIAEGFAEGEAKAQLLELTTKYTLPRDSARTE